MKSLQKQPSTGVPSKKCSENMQQTYKKHPCWSVISIMDTPRHGCPLINLLHIFMTPFTKNTIGWLLLNIELSYIALWKLDLDRQKDRSSHRRRSVRKSVLRNFTKSTGKHLRQSLICSKVAGPGLQFC